MRIAMIAITTNSSISVKPRPGIRFVRMGHPSEKGENECGAAEAATSLGFGSMFCRLVAARGEDWKKKVRVPFAGAPEDHSRRFLGQFVASGRCFPSNF